MHESFFDLVLDIEVESVRFLARGIIELSYCDGSYGLWYEGNDKKWHPSDTCSVVDSGSVLTGRELD
jgi:hypothetical protein